MAAGDRATPSIADLRRLAEGRGPATSETIHEVAVTALMVMQGLSRGEKLRVWKKMRRLLDA